ncbi:unnamed protein product [Allacma fusca]|uniref:Uncharacterized protein n=1 Tax=Allacma fusca TaxID=39272 RepID=A0A8J2KG66_9HEXA|nr:unnamed protein product [Allacma fusca]
MKIFLLPVILLWIIYFLGEVSGRPNPVPNDDINDQEFLAKYERSHDQSKRVKRHRRVTGPETPEDQDVIDELDVFKGIRRRNRDKRDIRTNIFKRFIDEGYYSSSDAS